VALHPYWAGEPAAGREMPAGRRSTRTPVGELKPAAGKAPPEGEDLSALLGFQEVTGYRLRAADGEVGGIEDLLVDDEAWKLRYLTADTDRLRPRREVLLAVPWIEEVDSAEEQLVVDLSCEEIRGGPEYESRRPVNRDTEEVVYAYYGRPRYWVGRTE
jgi:hypothetical protein